jgi:hypothetical protein
MLVAYVLTLGLFLQRCPFRLRTEELQEQIAGSGNGKLLAPDAAMCVCTLAAQDWTPDKPIVSYT